jgi:hypothetical protein
MAGARCAGLRFFAVALLSALLLSACGGGSTSPSELLSGTVANGAPLDGAAVLLHCADGSVFQSTTNHFGTWQVVVSTHPLPCALQASGGSINGLANSTAYHSVALSFGVNNITPLTDLVVARMLGADPQAWFDNPAFSAVNASAIQTALDMVNGALGLATALRQVNPLTVPFFADVGDYPDAVLAAMQATLVNPAVNRPYVDLLAAASAGDFSGFANFAATFATELANLYSH